VGALVHQQLISQFEHAGGSDEVAGARGAEAFTGMLVNFGTATALLGLTGELASLGLMKDFRLIGEQVSSGLGFSRLHRRVFGPLLKTTATLEGRRAGEPVHLDLDAGRPRGKGIGP
jgi:hypothetical protein